MAKPYCQGRRHIMLISRNAWFENCPNTAMTRHRRVAPRRGKHHGSDPREIRGGARPIVARALAHADVPGTQPAWRVFGPVRGHPDVSVRWVEGPRDRRRDPR